MIGEQLITSYIRSTVVATDFLGIICYSTPPAALRAFALVFYLQKLLSSFQLRAYIRYNPVSHFIESRFQVIMELRPSVRPAVCSVVLFIKIYMVYNSIPHPTPCCCALQELSRHTMLACIGVNYNSRQRLHMTMSQVKRHQRTIQSFKLIHSAG